MRGEFVDLDGVRQYCFAFGHRGAGLPIVLLHGAFTSSHLWQDVLPRLPKGHRVLVLDLLGHGRSDPPAAHGMTVAAHGRRLVALLDVLGVRQAMVVGHGMGAAIAAWLAHDQPGRVSQLMLVNPQLLAATPADATPSGRMRRLGWGLPLWRRLAPGWLASALHHALLPGFAHRDAGARALDVYLKPVRRRDGRDAACAQLRALGASRADTVSALAPGGLPCPTALILGVDDPFVTPARAQRLEHALTLATGGRLTTLRLPGAAHVIPEEAPDRLGTAVGALLTT